MSKTGATYHFSPQRTLRIEKIGAKRASPLLAPLLVLLLATALRFYRLAGQSLWSDEGNSVALARAGLAEIAARTALDIHPPLYYWLLHGWIRVFGLSEVAIRSLSVAAGVLLVAVVYRLGARLFERRVGLLAAFIAATSPFQVYYAQEARMYALLALFGALTIWATVETTVTLAVQKSTAETQRTLRKTNKSMCSLRLCGEKGATGGWAIFYVLSATAGLYTHYAFPVVLVAVNLAVLIQLWHTHQSNHGARKDREMVGVEASAGQEQVYPAKASTPRKATRPLGRWLLLQLIPLALYLPWLPIAWRQLTTWPAPLSTDAGSALVTTWRTLALGPVGRGANALWLVGLGLLGAVGLARLLGWEPWLKKMLLLLYLGLPIGLTLILFKPAYLKFLLVASPALCLVLALGLAGWRDRRVAFWGEWLGAGLVAAAAWGPLTAYYTDPAFARDDYRGIARYLEAVAGPSDAILLNAAGQQEVFGYYHRGQAPIYPLPRRRPLDPQATTAELEAILGQARHVYALYWATDESDPAGIVEGWLNEHAFKATDAWVGNVRLVSYAAPLPAGDLLPADVRLGDHVTLTGYRLLPVRTVPGEVVQVQLRWTTDAPLAARYVVFVQALDGANHLVGQRDAEPTLPTVNWTPGQPVLDRYGLLIEPGTPPGEQRVIVGLYDAASGQRLPTPTGDFIELGTLTVERPATPPPVAALRFRYPANADLGPLRLLGYDRYRLGHSYDPDTPLHPGDPLHVILYWQAPSQPQADWQVTLRLVPAADPAAPVAEGVFPAAGVDYPATRWQPGEIVRAQFDLFLPGSTPPGDYGATLRLFDQAGSPAGELFTLASISVE